MDHPPAHAIRGHVGENGGKGIPDVRGLIAAIIEHRIIGNVVDHGAPDETQRSAVPRLSILLPLCNAVNFLGKWADPE